MDVQFLDNLDAAVDEVEKILDDPLDDQDEEGKEIQHDLHNNNNNNEDDYDNNHADYEEDTGDARRVGGVAGDILNGRQRDHKEPLGIGAGNEIPQAPRPHAGKGEGVDDLDNHAMETFNENVDNIRNLGNARLVH